MLLLKNNWGSNNVKLLRSTFAFQGLRIDEALRLYLEAFRLPGEAPVIQRLLETFTDNWHVSTFPHKSHINGLDMSDLKWKQTTWNKLPPRIFFFFFRADIRIINASRHKQTYFFFCYCRNKHRRLCLLFLASSKLLFRFQAARDASSLLATWLPGFPPKQK